MSSEETPRKRTKKEAAAQVKREEKIASRFKSKANKTTQTQDLSTIYAPTGNIYEAITIIAKRANQIAVELKQAENDEMEDHRSYLANNDNLEEYNEDHELIEISKRFERLPKPTAMAMDEFLKGQVYYRRTKK